MIQLLSKQKRINMMVVFWREASQELTTQPGSGQASYRYGRGTETKEVAYRYFPTPKSPPGRMECTFRVWIFFVHIILSTLWVNSSLMSLQAENEGTWLIDNMAFKEQAINGDEQFYDLLKELEVRPDLKISSLRFKLKRLQFVVRNGPLDLTNRGEWLKSTINESKCSGVITGEYDLLARSQLRSVDQSHRRVLFQVAFLPTESIKRCTFLIAFALES